MNLYYFPYSAPLHTHHRRRPASRSPSSCAPACSPCWRASPHGRTGSSPGPWPARPPRTRSHWTASPTASAHSRACCATETRSPRPAASACASSSTRAQRRRCVRRRCDRPPADWPFRWAHRRRRAGARARHGRARGRSGPRLEQSWKSVWYSCNEKVIVMEYIYILYAIKFGIICS